MCFVTACYSFSVRFEGKSCKNMDLAAFPCGKMIKADRIRDDKNRTFADDICRKNLSFVGDIGII